MQTNVSLVLFNWLRSNDAKASITSTAVALGDLPKLLTNSFVTLLNLCKLIITGRTLVGSTGLSRYL
ncbi:hypothetical protein KNZ07_06530 [Streptococcus dysgalactiae subsp. equisimilis]|nr:hypothetical protein KNZ01_04280 [Streptococcus dysgalactiae subsp. equisimilis]GET76160.1 hypothetical protein KNZ07_06530 [Streptococcus dysgalactiae subsp. equisimilis]GET77533.1 hypothetical protein KNZ10_01050 [Streptococcus dysgalactiae subsp. equisimilis]GET80065.1 hypothetical protein KNZ12_07060 [Streptococcus dysgalactiae subsp. equisimilis]GET81956.1 hypothetical protein KNZ15_06550 [Streptococcus dysgalactiae subsp. equisimilis]